MHLGGSELASLSKKLDLNDPDRVPIRPAPKWMIKTWRGNAAAMTLPWAIYVHPEILGGDSSRLSRLIEHELVHVSQWLRLGPARFLRRYLGDYLRGRRRGLSHNQAYLAISLETEARNISGH
jgi:hypothetical protein